MFRNRVYYRIKPLVPRAVRLSVRRWFAVRKRARIGGRWPIMPGSERAPAGWPGWPDGKRFALVLTHDVEGQAGLNQCRQLLELEMKLGFRSSFNFIPEGEYTVPRELRHELAENGFEVGVHDLEHDGKLYRRREEFAQKAERINRYLDDWGAAGFRSGFMLHELDWLHHLNIEYDASTFDTDPFEPQPHGVSTIFPFWVPALGSRREEDCNAISSSDPKRSPPASPGYVELPYTLPQDSTLFLLLGERTPELWFEKLDWVASHSGMALINVHPDYIHFDREPASPWSFPVEIYAQFLEYAVRRYGASFWQPLPRDVAAFVAQAKPRLRPPPRRICMLTHSFYQADARVTRYTEALASRGDQVDVVALQSSDEWPGREAFANINLVRIQPRFVKNERSRLSYLVPLLRFLFVSSFWTARQHTRKRYDLLHVHNVPDFLVFAAWWPRLTGAKVILDIHDILPELYAAKFNSAEDSWSVTLLKWMERASARVAHRIIVANHLWLEKYAARTGANGKCSVLINHVDRQIFRPRPRTRQDGKFIVLFPGSLQRHQGLEVAIQAFQKVSPEIPQAEFHLYGDGDWKEHLVALTNALGLNAKIHFFHPRPIREIAEIMANADLGVVPKRADSFGNEAYSTKIMEFMSLGVPVIVARTRIDQYYFDDSVVRFFESGNPDALAAAMLAVARDAGLHQRVVTRASAYVARHCWETRKADYLHLVDSLIDSRPRVSPAPASHEPPDCGLRITDCGLRTPLRFMAGEQVRKEQGAFHEPTCHL